MRRLLACLTLLAALVAPALGEDLHIALGIQDATPAAGKRGDTGGLAAFNEELARDICRRIAARCTTSNVLFSEILPGIENGRFDLGFGNYLRTPEREQRVAFSAAIWRSSSRLVARSGSAAADTELATLRRARLAVLAETQQHAYLRRVAAERQLEVLTARTLAETFALLRDGQADFALLPMLSAYAMLVREPAGGFEFVGAPVTDDGLGGSVHIALPKGREALRLAVDRAIAAMRADGTYPRVVRRHFPFNVD